MNTESPEPQLKIQSLDKYGPTMTKEEIAEALHIPRHIIQPLTRAGLFTPLGEPKRYCVKHYSRAVIAKSMVDQDWLDRMIAAIHKHWRNKNARKRAKLAKLNGGPNGTPASESVTR
jgi:hypothetical protein